MSSVRELIVVRELGIKKTDQRNAESSRLFPHLRTSPTTVSVANLAEPTRTLKSSRK